MAKVLISMPLVALFVVGCAGAGTQPSVAATAEPSSPAVAEPSSPPVAEPSSPPVSEPSSPPVASSGLCDLFTPAELAPFLGAEPGPGSIGGPQDTLCQWIAGERDVMFQKVPVEYFEDPYLAEGYRRLDGIGDHAYVAPHMFGRVTAARTAEAGYFVVASEDTDEEMQIDLLRAFVERSPGPAILATLPPPAESGPPTSQPSFDPADCLVTTEEVTEAAGIEMTEGAAPCSWTAADAGTGTFEVYLADVPVSIFEHMDEDPVPGVGDEAYGDDFGLLYVRVGERGFSVQVLAIAVSEDLPDASDVAIEIARAAVENMR